MEDQDRLLKQLRGLSSSESEQARQVPEQQQPANGPDSERSKDASRTVVDEERMGEPTGRHELFQHIAVLAKNARSASRYVHVREIARGGMAVIHKVRDVDLSRNLAMKVMVPLVRDDARQGQEPITLDVARFLEEAQITAQLDHPGIVAVHDVGMDAGGKVFFTMQLVKGQELGTILRLAREHRDGWNLSRVVGVLVRACQAMAYAHSKGVIHRDLKPGNIMVGRFGEVFVMDWGLAKVLNQEDLHDIRLQIPEGSLSIISSERQEAAGVDSPLITMDGAVVGTPAYMPPEQARGNVEQVDKTSDVYSLGAIIYTLLAGRAPFTEPGVAISARTLLGLVLAGPPKPISQINNKAPPELIAICEKAMARDKQVRYPSSLELAEDLQAWIDHRVVKAYRTGALIEAKKWVARNRPLALALGTVALVLLFGLASILLVEHSANRKLTSSNVALDVARRQISSQLLASRTEQAQLTFAKGLELAERGDVAEGVHWMVQSLGVAPPGMKDFEKMVRGNISAWSQLLPKFIRNWKIDKDITCAAFSPDGRLLALGQHDGTVRLVKYPLGELLGAPLHFPRRMIASLEFHPTKPILAIGLAGDGDLSGAEAAKVSAFDTPSDAVLWDLSTSRPLGPPLPHGGGVHNVRFTSDGEFLITREYPGTTIRKWRIATGALEGTPVVLDQDQLGDDLFVSSSDRFVAVSMRQAGRGRVLSLPNFAVRDFPLEPNSSLRGFTPDGRQLLVRLDRAEDSTLELRELEHGTTTISLPFPNGIQGCRLTPDGRTVLALGVDSTIRSAEVQSGRAAWPAIPQGEAQWIALSPLGTRVVTEEADWELPAPLSRASAPIHRNLAGGSAIRFGRASDTVVEFEQKKGLLLTRPDGPQKNLAAARLWDLNTGLPRGLPLQEKVNAISDVALSPDGRLAATCAVADPGLWEFKVGSVTLWDAFTGLPRFESLPPDSPVAVLAFSPDSLLLAGGDYDGLIRFWDTRTGKETGDPLRVPEIVFSLTFSPNGKMIAAGTTRARMDFPHARLWDVESRKPLFDPFPGGDKDWVMFLAFTPDSSLLMIGSNHQVQIRDTRSGRLLFPPIRQVPEIFAARLSPDGSRLAIGDRDGIVRIFETATGKSIGKPLLHSRSVQCLDFQPGGSLLAAGYTDGSTRLWDCATSLAVGPPLAQKNAIFAVQFSLAGDSLWSVAQDGMPRHWTVPTQAAGSAEDLNDVLELWTDSRVERGGTKLLSRSDRTEIEARAQRHKNVVLCERISSRDKHLLIAADAEQDHDWFGATWHLRQLISLEPNNVSYHARLARSLSFAEEFAEADREYDRAKKAGFSSEELSSWYRQCAWDARDAQHWSAVEWYLDRFTQSGRPDWKVYLDRSIARAGLGQHSGAQSDYARALSLCGDAYAPTRSTQLASQNRWAELAEMYLRVEKAGWLSIEDWRRYALSLLKAGESDEYRACCKRLLALIGEKDIPKQVGLAAAQIAALGPCGKPEAMSVLRILPEISSKDSLALALQADVYLIVGDQEAARACLTQLGPQQEGLAALLKDLVEARISTKVIVSESPRPTDVWSQAEWALLESQGK